MCDGRCSVAVVVDFPRWGAEDFDTGSEVSPTLPGSPGSSRAASSSAVRAAKFGRLRVDIAFSKAGGRQARLSKGVTTRQT